MRLGDEVTAEKVLTSAGEGPPFGTSILQPYPNFIVFLHAFRLRAHAL
jgi:hypothetical protein